MYRKKSIQRREMIQAARKVIRERGMENFTARNVAAATDVSTHPIYQEFENMQILKEEVFKGCYNHLQEEAFQSDPHNPSLNQICLNFVLYASSQPLIFNAFYKEKTNYIPFVHYCTKKLFYQEVCLTELNDVVKEESEYFWNNYLRINYPSCSRSCTYESRPSS